MLCLILLAEGNQAKVKTLLDKIKEAHASMTSQLEEERAQNLLMDEAMAIIRSKLGPQIEVNAFFALPGLNL